METMGFGERLERSVYRGSSSTDQGNGNASNRQVLELDGGNL